MVFWEGFYGFIVFMFSSSPTDLNLVVSWSLVYSLSGFKIGYKNYTEKTATNPCQGDVTLKDRR